MRAVAGQVVNVAAQAEAGINAFGAREAEAGRTVVGVSSRTRVAERVFVQTSAQAHSFLGPKRSWQEPFHVGRTAVLALALAVAAVSVPVCKVMRAPAEELGGPLSMSLVASIAPVLPSTVADRLLSGVKTVRARQVQALLSGERIRDSSGLPELSPSQRADVQDMLAQMTVLTKARVGQSDLGPILGPNDGARAMADEFEDISARLEFVLAALNRHAPAFAETQVLEWARDTLVLAFAAKQPVAWSFENVDDGLRPASLVAMKVQARISGAIAAPITRVAIDAGPAGSKSFQTARELQQVPRFDPKESRVVSQRLASNH